MHLFLLILIHAVVTLLHMQLQRSGTLLENASCPYAGIDTAADTDRQSGSSVRCVQ